MFARIKLFTPSITIVDSPAPYILAPQWFKKSARSLISGSRAGFTIIVFPFEIAEAIIIFSVIPTLGKGNIILVPIIEVAQALIDEPFTLTSAPKS